MFELITNADIKSYVCFFGFVGVVSYGVYSCMANAPKPNEPQYIDIGIWVDNKYAFKRPQLVPTEFKYPNSVILEHKLKVYRMVDPIRPPRFSNFFNLNSARSEAELFWKTYKFYRKNTDTTVNCDFTWCLFDGQSPILGIVLSITTCTCISLSGFYLWLDARSPVNDPRHPINDPNHPIHRQFNPQLNWPADTDSDESREWVTNSDSSDNSDNSNNFNDFEEELEGLHIEPGMRRLMDFIR